MATLTDLPLTFWREVVRIFIDTETAASIHQLAMLHKWPILGPVPQGFIMASMTVAEGRYLGQKMGIDRTHDGFWKDAQGAYILDPEGRRIQVHRPGWHPNSWNEAQPGVRTFGPHFQFNPRMALHCLAKCVLCWRFLEDHRVQSQCGFFNPHSSYFTEAFDRGSWDLIRYRLRTMLPHDMMLPVGVHKYPAAEPDGEPPRRLEVAYQISVIAAYGHRLLYYTWFRRTRALLANIGSLSTLEGQRLPRIPMLTPTDVCLLAMLSPWFTPAVAAQLEAHGVFVSEALFEPLRFAVGSLWHCLILGNHPHRIDLFNYIDAQTSVVHPNHQTMHMLGGSKSTWWVTTDGWQRGYWTPWALAMRTGDQDSTNWFEAHSAAGMSNPVRPLQVSYVASIIDHFYNILGPPPLPGPFPSARGVLPGFGATFAPSEMNFEMLRGWVNAARQQMNAMIPIWSIPQTRLMIEKYIIILLNTYENVRAQYAAVEALPVTAMSRRQQNHDKRELLRWGTKMLQVVRDGCFTVAWTTPHIDNLYYTTQYQAWLVVMKAARHPNVRPLIAVLESPPRLATRGSR